MKLELNYNHNSSPYHRGCCGCGTLKLTLKWLSQRVCGMVLKSKLRVTKTYRAVVFCIEFNSSIWTIFDVWRSHLEDRKDLCRTATVEFSHVLTSSFHCEAFRQTSLNKKNRFNICNIYSAFGPPEQSQILTAPLYEAVNNKGSLGW